MDVSIIIVNYNTKKLLYNCLLSIQQQTQGLKYEIIVIDNGSIDGSIEFIHNFFPSIMIIPSPQNLGFGRANNLGAKYANGKYLFFLNPDTILLNNAVKYFFDYMENSTFVIGAVGGQLLDENNHETYSYDYFPSISSESLYIWNKIFHRSTIPPLSKNPMNVDFIIGADLFIPKIKFQELDGFDPNFFMYYEETDLQKRMKMQNLKRIIIPEAHIVHFNGGAFDEKGFTFNRFILSQRSMNYYISKHFHGFYYFAFRLIVAFLRLSLFSKRLTKHWTWEERFSAYFHVLKK